ncbi:MAG TPA: LPS assembly lipoprotein LptE [Flavisolibacter sp.]
MKRNSTYSYLLLLFFVMNIAFVGCYGFKDINLDANVKTVRVDLIENRAQYRNPQVAPNLTDRLKQKITNQTRLTQTNNENAHWYITGEIRDYSVSTSGISTTDGRSQTSVNRLTVSVHIVKLDNIKGETTEFDVTRQFDFGANQSLQTAEAQLLDEMIRNLTDEIFNKLFSNW